MDLQMGGDGDSGGVRRRPTTRRRLYRQALVQDLVDALWPDRCWVCHRAADSASGPATCADHALVETSTSDRCRRCAGPLAEGISRGSVCSVCRRAPPPFGRAVCAFHYGEPAVRAWILALKHGGRTDLATALVAAAWRAIREREPGLGSTRALLVPVPLHLSRRIERGHDQAARLAREFAALGAGRFCPILRRVRATWSQGDPVGPGRRKNVRGAFRGVPAVRIPGDCTVWIVDDVMTTGATAAACAQTLKAMGATEVNLLTLARA